MPMRGAFLQFRVEVRDREKGYCQMKTRPVSTSVPTNRLPTALQPLSNCRADWLATTSNRGANRLLPTPL